MRPTPKRADMPTRVRVESEHGHHDVDTGFIVMNDRNYPNFTRLLDRLGVARQPTHMSFSVKGEEEDFEYAGTPRGLFCQPSNILSPRFQRMIFDLCASTASCASCSRTRRAAVSCEPMSRSRHSSPGTVSRRRSWSG